MNQDEFINAKAKLKPEFPDVDDATLDKITGLLLQAGEVAFTEGWKKGAEAAGAHLSKAVKETAPPATGAAENQNPR